MFFKRLYDYIFRTKWTVATAVTAAAVLLAIVQFGAIIYINLFALKHHIDSDFSINILRLTEIDYTEKETISKMKRPFTER